MKKTSTIKKWAPCLLLLLAMWGIGTTRAYAQLSGTKTVGTGATDYATLTQAIAALNTQGVGNGGVVFEVSAGHQENASNLLITATGNAADPVVFRKSGTGANPLVTATAGSGALDGVIKIKGADYITFESIDLLDPSSNNSANSAMEWGYAILKSGDEDGASHITITGCSVTLQSINSSSVGIYAANHNDTTVDERVLTAASGVHDHIRFTNNLVSGAFSAIKIAGYANATYRDFNNEITGNVVTGFGGNIAENVHVINVVNQRNALISGNAITASNIMARDINAITSQGPYTKVIISNNTVIVSSSQPASGRTIRAINNINASGLDTIIVSGNMIKNSTVTGGFTGIYNNAVAAYLEISADSVYGIDMLSSGIWFEGINNAAGATATGTQLIKNNIVYNVSGSGMRYGITGNSSNATIDSNQVYNITSSSGYSEVTGISYLKMYNATASVISCTGNKVFGLNGMGFHTVGIKLEGITVLAKGNEVHDITSGAVTYGIWVKGKQTITRNNIYSLHSTAAWSEYEDGTFSGAVMAIAADAGTTPNTININNNLITGLHAPYSENGHDVRAISLNTMQGVTETVSYNTVYLNARPVSSNWGSSVLYHNHFNTSLQVNNNIFVNTSESRGAGNTVVSYGYSNTTLSKYSNLSNNNLFYAGKPSSRNLIYYVYTWDNSIKDSLLYQYQQRVGASADSLSFSEMPVFLDTVPGSPNYLRINPTTPTQIESGAVMLNDVIGDYTDDAKRASTLYPLTNEANGGGTAPDLGAFEGDYTPAPSMTYVSSDLVKASGEIYRNVQAQQITRIRVVTSGALNRIHADSFTFETSSTTNISDVLRARVYYTVNRDIFDTSLLFGSTTSINTTFGIKGTQRLLSADTNYFWLAYDIAPTAAPGSIIDALCPEIRLSSGAVTPAVINPADVKVIPAPLAGTYTIGTSGNYASLTNAIADMNRKGISANVVFELNNTSYTAGTGEVFPLVINHVVGSSSADSVLFKVSGSTDVSIASNNGPAFILNGADHVNISGYDNASAINRLSISGTTAAIWIQNDITGDSATNNTLNNLNISAPAIGIGIGSRTINTSGYGLGLHYNKILNCRISDASTSVYSAGSGNRKNIGNVISGNTITRGGILVMFEDSVQIIRNKLSAITSTVYGISLGISSINTFAPSGFEVTNAHVSGNEILTVYQQYSAAAVGIAVASASYGTNTLDNNLVYDVKSNGASNGHFTAGIYVGGGTGATKVYFNTVLLKGTTTRTTPSSYAIAIGGLDPVIDLKNNIFYNTQTAGVNSNTYAIGFASPSPLFSSVLSNNNVYFTSGANAKFAVTGGIGLNNAGTIAANIAALRSTTLQDTNSVELDPVIDSASGFKPNVLPAIKGGQPLAGFETDKAGITRGVATPTIGAYEVLPVTDDIGVLKAVYMNNELHVLLRNYGDNYINTYNVNYTINNGPVVITFSSNQLPPRDTASVIISPFTIPNGINTVKVFSALPNGIADVNITNDTATVSLFNPLAGTYTIGGQSPDYATLSDAVNELNIRGISAAVTFNIRTGTYFEHIEIKNVKGADALNTVTFTSEADHADSVVISYGAATVPADNYVIKLNSASYVTIKKLTLTATGLTYGSIINIADSASYDSISYCKLEGVPVTANQYYHALVFGNDCYGNGIVVNNNAFRNGARGIYYYGLYDPSRNIYAGDKNVFERNTFTNNYGNSIYVIRTKNARINYNVITNTANTGHYGITLENCDSALQVIGNKIRIEQTGTGLDIKSSRGNPLKKGIIASNEINIGDGDGIRQSRNGLWDGGIYYMNYYHNTVKVSSPNGYAAFFDIDDDVWYYNTNTFVEVKNNVFANTGGGFALRAPLKDPLIPAMQIDYNSLYTSGTYLARQALNTNYVLDSQYTNLAAWRIATPFDAHSLSHRPVFKSANDISPESTDTLGWLLNGRAIHLDLDAGYVSTVIDKDVNGNNRATTYYSGVPDIGAHEFTPSSVAPLATAIPAQLPGLLTTDTTQLFIFHDDTVAQITWKANYEIPAVTVRQYSGVIPVTVSPTQNYMYFYTDIEAPTNVNYNYLIGLYYREGWKGTNPVESDVRLAKKDGPGIWQVPNSGLASIDTVRNIMYTDQLSNFSLFSGTDQFNPMPVKLLSFNGKKVNNDVVLSWVTASEVNNKGFEIQRSADGKRFETIGFVNGNGNAASGSTYNFTDVSVIPGVLLYYRLKQVDFNNTFDYSNTVIINAGQNLAEKSFVVFPNPFNNALFITVESASASDALITVYDVMGKQVSTGTLQVSEGLNTLSVPDAGNLPKGVYYISITVNGQKQTSKLIKN